MNVRTLLSMTYAKGHGIELGAFHNPFPLSPGVKVTYLDKHPYEKTRQIADNDRTLGPKVALAKVDIVDCGERLFKVNDEQFDFLVSSHQLEHVYSPFHAVFNHLRVIKTGGNLIYALPDMRYTFDKDRELTDIPHLVSHWMYENQAARGRLIDHHDEYLQFVDKIEDPEARRIEATRRADNNEDVHFHTWTSESMIKMFLEMQGHFEQFYKFEIEFFTRGGHENFIVLRKL